MQAAKGIATRCGWVDVQRNGVKKLWIKDVMSYPEIDIIKISCSQSWTSKTHEHMKMFEGHD